MLHYSQRYRAGYGVYAGNTHEAPTPEDFLDCAENRCRQVRRIWLMDRGIPTAMQWLMLITPFRINHFASVSTS